MGPWYVVEDVQTDIFTRLLMMFLGNSIIWVESTLSFFEFVHLLRTPVSFVAVFIVSPVNLTKSVFYHTFEFKR